MQIVTDPAHFFSEVLTSALKNQGLTIEPETYVYIVNLMSRFMITDALFTVTEDGIRREETLALLLTNAVNESNTTQQKQKLQRLGDISLYTAGFLSDRLSKKIVDLDYYIGMGRQAYSALAKSDFEKLMKNVFKELADRFPRLVDILLEVSQETSLHNSKDILRVYEMWLKTGSEQAEKNLKKVGIIPNKNLKSA